MQQVAETHICATQRKMISYDAKDGGKWPPADMSQVETEDAWGYREPIGFSG